MPRDELRKFLISNGLRTSQYTSLEPLMGCDDGAPEEEEKEIITVLRRKGIDCNLRFVLPWADTPWTYDPSAWVFIAFYWVYFLSNKRIDNELDKPVPASFERLRQMLQVQSPIGQYLLRSERPFEWSLKGLSEELNKVKCSSPKTMFCSGLIFDAGSGYLRWVRYNI